MSLLSTFIEEIGDFLGIYQLFEGPVTVNLGIVALISQIETAEHVS